MPVTLTSNYKEFLTEETVANIEDWCIEGDFDLEDALKFIDENDEHIFNAHYEDFIAQGEIIGYEIVDAFVSEFGWDDVQQCAEACMGTYRTEADFAEEYLSDMCDIPDCVVVDWQETWERNLYYDFTFVSMPDSYDGAMFRSHW